MHLSALHSISPLGLLKKKPPLTTILKAGAMMSPLGLAGGVAVIGGGIAVKSIYEHRGEIKSSLHSVGDKVKDGSVAVGDTIGKTGSAFAKSAGKAGGAIVGGFEKMMIPVMIVGSLVVVMMILKK